MPIITALTAQRRPDYINVFLDGEFYCGLSVTQVADFRLHKGQELSESAAEDIQNASAAGKAYSAAIRYLAYRMRSEKEVRDRLKLKGHEEYSDEVVARLIREQYLDDTDFATRWVHMRIDQNFAPRKIQSELLQKGITKETIDEVLEEYQEEDRLASLKATIQKRLKRGPQPRQKLISYLMGKGFGYSDINAVLTDEAEGYQLL